MGTATPRYDHRQACASDRLSIFPGGPEAQSVEQKILYLLGLLNSPEYMPLSVCTFCGTSFGRLPTFWRRMRDLNPRKVALYTLSKRAHSAAMRILLRGQTLSVVLTMITPDPSYGVTVPNSPRAGMQQG